MAFMLIWCCEFVHEISTDWDRLCGVLYHSSGAVPPTLSEQPFREHKLMITSGVVFLFDDLMYR